MVEFAFLGIGVKNLHNSLPAIIGKRAVAGMEGKYPYSLVDFEIVMKASRSPKTLGRIFRILKMVLNLPAFDRVWEYQVPLEIAQGEEAGEAKFTSFSLPLDFVEPREAQLEISFSDGRNLIGSTIVPVQFIP